MHKHPLHEEVVGAGHLKSIDPDRLIHLLDGFYYHWFDVLRPGPLAVDQEGRESRYIDLSDGLKPFLAFTADNLLLHFESVFDNFYLGTIYYAIKVRHIDFNVFG